MSYRQTHNALRQLWIYAHDQRSDPARLINMYKNLPATVRAKVEQRAKFVVRKLFPAANIDAGFILWASAR